MDRSRRVSKGDVYVEVDANVEVYVSVDVQVDVEVYGEVEVRRRRCRSRISRRKS